MTFESYESIYAFEQPDEMAEHAAATLPRTLSRSAPAVPAPCPAPIGYRPPVNAVAAFGPAPGSRRPDPHNYHKRTVRTLPDPAPFVYPSRAAGRTLPPIPAPAPAPARHAPANYIKANTLAVVHSIPGRPGRRVPRADAASVGVDWTLRPEYGAIPAYLGAVKAQVAEEEAMIQEMELAQAQEEQMAQVQAEAAYRRTVGAAEPLDEEERVRILEALRSRWERLNKQYQKCSGFQQASLARADAKATLEAEIAETEILIDAMSRPVKIVP